MAGSNYQLPPPPPLDIHDPQVSEKWTRFKQAWTNYAVATELDKKSQQVQVATFLTVIGEDAREVYSTFTDWRIEGDESKIDLNSMNIAVRERTFHLRGTASTADNKNLVKPTNSIVQHYTNSHQLANFKLSLRKKY